MKRLLLILSAFALFAAACTQEADPYNYKWRDEWREVEQPVDTTETEEPAFVGKPRYVWIDAAANFQFYANNAAAIASDCRRLAEIGFTDLVVDVRPTSGDVLFTSAVAPACKKVGAWVNGTYKWVERTADFDYLATFIAEGHLAGLRVNAGINTMVGGVHTTLGDLGMVYDNPALRSWCSVDNTASGLTNALDITDKTGARFLDPSNAEVQEFLLTLLGELASYPGLDGIVLDRCRYDDTNMDAGYTDAAKAAFTAYLGEEPSSWPVMPQGASLASNPPQIQKHWLTFRCKTIHDFMEKAVEKVHGINPKVRFGVYVGAWFSSYYMSGVNWTSSSYKVKNESSYKWVPDAYQSTGFADLLDFIFLGAYASTNAIHGTGEWTMEGFAKLGKKRLCGVVPFIPGPDIGNGTGFENGHQEALFPDITSTLMKEADGMFIFDLCHIRQFDYWDAVKAGFDAYLETVETINP